MKLPFWKVEAIGNDFPLFHLEDVAHLNLSELAIRASDRRFGIGGDGILVVSTEASPSLSMRMFNPDGSEDFCGNGLRCAAGHLHAHGYVGDEFAIQHLDTLVPISIHGKQISTELGVASYSPDEIPAKFANNPEVTFDRTILNWNGKPVIGSSLTTGSTHLVIPGPIPTEEEFLTVSPILEVLPEFPERTSVIWAEEAGTDRLRIRIWERGVGETLGCGTGSTAAAVDWVRRRGYGGKIAVENRGGTIEVTVRDLHSRLKVTGDFKETYSGEFLG